MLTTANFAIAWVIVGLVAVCLFFATLVVRSLPAHANPAKSYQRRRWANLCLKGTAACALFEFGGCAYWYEPYFAPERYLDRLERNSAPLIEAIDRFVAEHGRPPNDLSQLMPSYLSSLPRTGYRPQPGFNYFTGDADNSPYWEIYVFCEPFDIFEPDEMCFDSRHRAWHGPR